MRIRTYHRGLFRFPEGGTSWTLGLGMGMGIRTWHRGMSFRFILSLMRHHQDSMAGGVG